MATAADDDGDDSAFEMGFNNGNDAAIADERRARRVGSTRRHGRACPAKSDSTITRGIDKGLRRAGCAPLASFPPGSWEKLKAEDYMRERESSDLGLMFFGKSVSRLAHDSYTEYINGITELRNYESGENQYVEGHFRPSSSSLLGPPKAYAPTPLDAAAIFSILIWNTSPDRSKWPAKQWILPIFGPPCNLCPKISTEIMRQDS